ncbi:TraY domain-containing protein [Cupriavidus sp. SIMBA_020]|uniref:TraY domain-containing protein n=1 Tax=Cupriavidus sp. SIMBA_020 TaxID=3085766 RepID=UPI003978436D
MALLFQYANSASLEIEMKGYQPTPFGLRMDPELKEWLTEQAQRSFRSLNAEIVFRLKESRTKQAGAADERLAA